MKHNHAAKWLALAGLIIMACGGLFYALSIRHDFYGLIGAGVGLLLVLAAALVARTAVGVFFARRSARLGLGSGIAILAVLALVMFLGALATRHHVRWDFSQGASYTLSPQTIKVLRNLEEPVKAYAFFKDTQAGRPQAQEELEKYAYASRKFTYRFVNPDHEPTLAKSLGVRNYGTVVLVSGGKDEKVQLPEEQELTNALIRLDRTAKKMVYFLTGHGEPSLDGVGKEDLSTLRKAIEANNYQVKSLMLVTSSQVPPDAAVVIIAGPEKPLRPEEIERLSAYQQGGGSVLMLLDPDSDAGLTGWLGKRGVVIGQDLIIDQAARLAGLSPLVPVINQYGFHEITKLLAGTICFFPQARSVSLSPKPPAGVKGEELVKSSAASWATNYKEFLAWYAKQVRAIKEGTGQEKSIELRPGPNDRKGPISMGVAATIQGKAEDKGKTPPAARLVIFGDSNFVNNEFLDLGGNHDLAMNSISWLAEDEDLVSIRAKKKANQPLLLQPFEERLLFWVPLVVWPLIVAIIGAIVIIRRRRG
ncbi:MAG: GldG family protein [Desulfarculaceae bacterium]|nr:GldG family protein [Desulfarculaceae bacterium]MCF8071392.1 GldG family protein [Desulfarculaceae bacterium]MCF8101717.1 GldG family protein [Desulfarculaceae bacterium]MCF8118191.1 GldG family protein [Desulfarculaceae bacterium]